MSVLVALCAGALAPGGVATAADTPAAAPAMVSVVHGVRGLVADVRVDGKLVLSGFAPERVTDPLALPAGTHRVQIWTTGAPASAKPALDTSVTVTAGSHATLAVGLTSSGSPQLTPYDDKPLAAGASSSAFAVRNIAATAPVRVTLDGNVAADSIVAPQQKVTSVAAGSHTVAVEPAAGGAPIFPAQTVPTVAGRATALYLIGSAKDNSLGWVVQPIRPASPTNVETGVGPPSQPAAEAAYLRLSAIAGVGLLGLFVWMLRTRGRRAGEAASW